MLVQYHTVTQYKRSISQSICIYINVQKAIVDHISYMQIYSDNVVLPLHTCDVVTRVGAFVYMASAGTIVMEIITGKFSCKLASVSSMITDGSMLSAANGVKDIGICGSCTLIVISSGC